ncbi:MAG: DUF3667 domain-containing protein [Bacteroidales bacterium]
MEMSSQAMTLKQNLENLSCKNCQTPFQGHYCPQCGQSAKDYERPLHFLIIDFAGNAFAFDTRVWRTLITLLIRPGKLETEYSEGKRARYMPPFRLYIFMSFLFFLLLSFYTNRSLEVNMGDINSAFTNAGYPANLQDEYDSPPAGNEQGQELRESSSTAGSTGAITASEVMSNIQRILQNPENYFARFFKYLSWALFLLMPIYGFFLWALFRKSRKYYISHFLLSTNQHVFIFMILIVMILIQLIFPLKTVAPETYLLYLVPVYSLAGARKLYQKSWIATIVRLATALVVYAMVAALATAMVVYFSFFG